MDKNVDVGIISLFHRGNWLASELSQQGKNVVLFDLSSNFPRWTPSDWEGPFGIFKNKGLLESQVNSLTQSQSIVDSEDGFCLWPSDGPIEFNGPLSRLQLNRYKNSQDIIDYFKSLSLSEGDLILQAKLKKGSFRDVWPVYFAHNLAATRYSENHLALSNPSGLPFMSDFFHRLSSRIGLEDALDACDKQGVEVFKECKLRDISHNNKELETIEIEVKGRSFLRSAKKWIIMLSGAEISMLDDRVRQILQPHKEVEPKWAWLRYSIDVEQIEDLKSIPPHFAVIDDVYSPWYGTNLMLFQTTMKENQLDVWLRIPNAQRFQQQYLEDMAKSIARLMQNRLPMFKIIDTVMPQEYRYGFNELGPPRFCMYDSAELRMQKRVRWPNLIWSSPEEWPAQDWTSIMREQSKILALFEEDKKHDRTL